MTASRFVAPSPRPEVADSGLSRPDWVGNNPRDPAKLWLDKNENTDPLMIELVRSVIAALPPEAGFTYPDLGPVYRKLGPLAGVPPQCLLLTPGSDGAIRAVFEAYIAPGDVVLHTVPTFAMYGVYARMYGAKVVGLEYRPSDCGPVLDADAIIDAIATTRPKLVCLPNPDSPTGTVFGLDEMRHIIEAAGRAGALILVDEAYYPFHGETVLPWVTAYPHLVVCRSTGKAWGMAGVRVGYAAAAPDVAKMLHKVRAMYEVGALSAAVFERMLDHEAEMRASVARLAAGKAGFLGAMRALGFQTLSGQGNFLHVAFGASAQPVHAALEPLVYYRKDFAEPCLKGFSRFSATTAERFAPVIACIEDVVRGNSKS
ncbi:Histidinol-phosphate/aromatic aminotransferase and cobyric acid decarboxylase [Candidatus Terasakiella magnetica]|nr:Histidinol-phosphate/aromatic aminotransferase and cobyric acid decarboxylase [Candidatus Terasakiella magnetica]